MDGDGVGNDADNCPELSNSDQSDGDGLGEACGSAIDGGGIENAEDNCPLILMSSILTLMALATSVMIWLIPFWGTSKWAAKCSLCHPPYKSLGLSRSCDV